MGQKISCTFGLLKEVWTQELASFKFVELYYILLQKKREFSFLPPSFVTKQLFSAKKIAKVTSEFRETYPQFISEFHSHGIFLIPFVSPSNSARNVHSKWNLIVLNRNSDIFGSARPSSMLYMHFFNGTDHATDPFRPSQRKWIR